MWFGNLKWMWVSEGYAEWKPFMSAEFCSREHWLSLGENLVIHKSM